MLHACAGVCVAVLLKSRHDVFDYAELCARMSPGMKDDGIADLLGWNNRQVVIWHRNIKKNLHPRSWRLATEGVTRNHEFVTIEENPLVTTDVTIVTSDWKESHFRAFLSHLPCPNGDRAMMRAQVRAITELMSKPDKHIQPTPTVNIRCDVATWVLHCDTLSVPATNIDG